MFEQEVPLSAIVSPDAAYFLGMLNLTPIESEFWSDGKSSKSENEWAGAEDAITALARSGIAPFPVPRICYYAFVPDSTPLGVVPDIVLPADEFKAADGTTIEEIGNGQKIIGFGLFTVKGNGKKEVVKSSNYNQSKGSFNEFFELQLSSSVELSNVIDSVGKLELGGNIYGNGTDAKSYFDLVKEKNYSAIDQDTLREIVKNEKKENLNISERRFAEVYDPLDSTSVQARQYYDEDYDQNVKVIAGNGRTLQQATGIWDQFRFGYHTYTNVKESFQRAYGLDPDSEEQIPNAFLSQPNTTSAADFRRFESADPNNKDEMESAAASLRDKPFAKYSSSGGTAEDEFSTIFGDSFFETPYQFKDESGLVRSSVSPGFQANLRTGLEQARVNFIDAGKENDGLIDYFNDLVLSKAQRLRVLILEGLKQSGVQPEDADQYIQSITTPKQLFLFVVGAFRNTMWKDPYARAWLVLKPNMKYTFDKDQWDFNPVLKIFQAFIDPNEDYAKKPDKFKKLLAANRSEGRSSSNWFGKTLEDVDGFWDKNVGPLFSAIGDSLSGLVNLFRMSMMQLGYGLSQVGQMSKQANILNKVLNDSIYYSLGRPGSLLRAVDNPFTREYGEPVIEIRQPFQRIHYLSSFSHILSNGITENINGVATMVTAVSDGKYPVTVALDKSAPPERQVEKTVETGLYFDNVVGSGLFGALHPIMHPFEFARGISKVAQGTPDELLAKRVALSHLRESLKDIYTGEIVIIGNADIRPHDLVYLADVYERMYGMFEVEQVVHHFTSELGFVTSITPNALVTVNDPARWFMSSWIGTWLHMQSLRNDTRMYMSSLGSGINNMGQVSVDGLSDSLQSQMIGGMQYTHGASAITKDIMAHFASEGIADINSQVKGLVSNQSAFTNGSAKLGGLGTMFTAATALGGAALGIASLAVPGAGALVVGAATGIGAGIGGRTAWKGWSWIRDNVLDQHGCYIQYLNRNGRAMDAGLNQSGQGMVVGRYHTKKLLPGILGVSSKVRTEQGYSYIRTNDLLKNLGWKEKEINDLVRYVDLENALVNSQVLRYSGIGPEKAGLNRFFKVICRVTEVTDGDTIDVVDIFDSTKTPFTIRFLGVAAPELNVIKSAVSTNNGINFKVQSYRVEDIPGEAVNKAIFTTVAPHSFEVDDTVAFNQSSETFPSVSSAAKVESVTSNTFTIATTSPVVGLTSTNAVALRLPISDSVKEWSSVNYLSPGGKSLAYVESAIKDKLIIVRLSPDTKKVTASLAEENFDAGNVHNKSDYYEKDIFGTRSLGVIFYKSDKEAVDNIAKEVNSIFGTSLQLSLSDLLDKKLKLNLAEPVFIERFKEIFSTCEEVYNNLTVGGSGNKDYYSLYASSPLQSMSPKFKRYYNAFFAVKVLEYIYGKVSEWPNIEWDEFYSDGTPASLNYELIVNNLAKVYTKDLLVEQRSVIDGTEMAALPSQIEVNRNT